MDFQEILATQVILDRQVQQGLMAPAGSVVSLARAVILVSLHFLVTRDFPASPVFQGIQVYQDFLDTAVSAGILHTRATAVRSFSRFQLRQMLITHW